MRSSTLVTAAILMFGCAQGGPATNPSVDVSGAGGPGAPAAPPPGPCDPSIADPVVVDDTGACPGVLPRPTGCAVDLTICSGTGVSGDGAYGNAAASGTSDGRGSIVLSCRRADVGPSPLNYLFVPAHGALVSKAPLGVDVRPLRDGFVASDGPRLPPAAWDFLAHDGDLRAAQEGGALYAGADGAVIVRAESGQLLAQSFAADGTASSTVAIGAFAGPASALTLDGARIEGGATLVIWQVYGQAEATARWLDPDGSPATGPFAISGWTDRAPQAKALAGAAVAIAAEPESGATARRWRGVIAAGESVERAAPDWLATRGDFFLLPGARAMAFGAEVVGPDGTVCGTVDAGAPLVGIGLDGTAFTARSERTFRVHPQLFR